NAGLGPIILISPRSILMICGNSSNDVFLKNLPILVIYWSGLSNKCVGVSLGVSILIVLNFNILKCVLCIPIRFCLNKIGPLESNLMPIINPMKRGDNITNPKKDRTTSMILLSFMYIKHNFLYIYFQFARTYLKLFNQLLANQIQT